MALAPPLINGNYYDFSSITITLATGTKIVGFKSINYTSEQPPGDVYGTARQKLGRTGGQNKASGSFEIYRPEFLDLQTALQGPTVATGTSVSTPGVAGLHEVNFPIIVTFSEAAPLGVNLPIITPIQTDIIVGARITKVDAAMSQGSDALTVKCDFDAMVILFNNATPLNQLLKAANLT